MNTKTIFCICALSVLLSAGMASAQSDSLTFACTVHQIRDVVVTGTRNGVDPRHLPQTVTSIGRDLLVSRQQMSLLPAIGDLTPGLYGTSRGVIGYGVSTNAAGSLKVRGIGSGPQMLVLIDGQPQYAGLMGHPVPDAYQTLMAEKVEVLRGPASMLYGSNAMGGVVNIVTRSSVPPTIGSSSASVDARISGGSYGTLQAEAAYSYAYNKFGIFVGGNKQRTDGHRANSAFDQNSGFAKAEFFINDNLTLAADANITGFEFDNPGPVSAPLFDAHADIFRGLASLSLRNKFDRTNGSLRIYYDWGHHKINDGHLASAKPRAYLYKHDDFIGGISLFQSASLFAGNRTTLGFDWQRFGGEAWNDSINGGNKYYDAIENQDEVAAYLAFRQDVGSFVTLDMGLRVDNHSQTGTHLIPQGGVSFLLPSDQSVKLLVSKGFRNPIISEMYMFAPNADLDPEELMNYEVAYSLRTYLGHFGANIFLIKADNLISRMPNPSGAGFKQMNVGSATNHGFELEGSLRINQFFRIDANYSYLHMRTPVTGAPEGKLYVGVRYDSPRICAGLNLLRISGLYTAVEANPVKQNYTTLGANVSVKVLQHLAAFVTADNILAERYETYEGFPMPKATVMAGLKFDFRRPRDHSARGFFQ